MSDEIQQNRYDQIIRRVAGIIGPGSKVSEVITELFPMIDVEDLPAELLRLGGTRLCFGGGVISPVVAQAATAQLFNPADSGALVTITRVDCTASITSSIRWGVIIVVRGAGIGTETFRDTRDPITSRPIAQVRQETAVALATGTNQATQPGNNVFTLLDPNAICVLAPGTGFEIGLTGLNINMLYSFVWRERPALGSELNV